MFGVGYCSLPRIRTFEEAKRHYDTVVPIRGNGCNAGVRPFGDRKKTHLEIIKLDRPRETYALKMYRTPVLQWRLNEAGTETEINIYLGGWDTQSTHSILNSALYAGSTRAFDNKTWLDTPAGTFQLNIHEDNWCMVEPVLMPLEPKPPTIHRVGRAVMAQKRKELSELRTYIINMDKVRGSVYSVDEAEKALKATEVEVDPLNPEVDPYEATLYLLSLAMPEHIRNYIRWSSPQNSYYPPEIKLEAKAMLQALDDLIKRKYRDEIFEEVETRRAQKDYNGKFFR